MNRKRIIIVSICVLVVAVMGIMAAFKLLKADDSNITYNKSFSDEVEAKIAEALKDDDTAYVLKEDNALTLCINMGEIKYSYYEVEVDESEDKIVCKIVKKDALNDSDATNILRATIETENTDKALEVIYEGKIMDSRGI